jgi:hypothetical protein
MILDSTGKIFNDAVSTDSVILTPSKVVAMRKSEQNNGITKERGNIKDNSAQRT